MSLTGKKKKSSLPCLGGLTGGQTRASTPKTGLSAEYPGLDLRAGQLCPRGGVRGGVEGAGGMLA